MKKRRILLALIMLIISGISLTTATYAWFTANRKVTVDEIDVRAQSSGGIQISADAETWTNFVDTTALMDEGLPAKGINNYVPTNSEALSPVTTIGKNGNAGKFDFYLGTLDESGNNVSLASVADSDKKYIAFDLYFYSATAQNVSFDAAATSIVAKAVVGSETVDAKLKSSVRVGFLWLGTDATATPATARALNGLDGSNADISKQTIWEPHADTHTTYATNQLGASGVMSYMGGFKATGDTAVATNNTTYFETITSAGHNLIQSNTGSVPANVIFPFPAGINKVRVYIWLEGQDIDNEDTASLGSGVGVTLAFKIPDAA